MASHDLVGTRGEAIVCAALTAFHGRRLPYFHPHPLGEKCATLDFLAELLGVVATPMYCLFQVKATRQGYTGGGALRASVGRDEVRRISRSPIPAYVIGVDEPNERGFLVSFRTGRRAGLASIPTGHPLDAANLRVLWDEVRDHWRVARPVRPSAFQV